MCPCEKRRRRGEAPPRPGFPSRRRCRSGRALPGRRPRVRVCARSRTRVPMGRERVFPRLFAVIKRSRNCACSAMHLFSSSCLRGLSVSARRGLPQRCWRRSGTESRRGAGACSFRCSLPSAFRRWCGAGILLRIYSLCLCARGGMESRTGHRARALRTI